MVYIPWLEEIICKYGAPWLEEIICKYGVYTMAGGKYAKLYSILQITSE